MRTGKVLSENGFCNVCSYLECRCALTVIDLQKKLAKKMRPAKKNETLIAFTKKELQQLGLITCKCGHPDNNHFEWGTRPCAHCKCSKYRQVVRFGRLVP